ncbi:MAG: GNAT family N-acetyltransferase [Burkholderiales bacterium]
MRKNWNNQNLPDITVAATACFYKTFTAPNPDFKLKIFNAAGDQVGTSSYCVSPLVDRVYLFEIEIFTEYRRQGYGTALLRYLAKAHGQPITAVKELFSANDFWMATRRLNGSGVVVTNPLSVGDMPAEASRWEHLRPDIERLEKRIEERLGNQEPWHVAVGRGLDLK